MKHLNFNLKRIMNS